MGVSDARECLALVADTSLSGVRVARELGAVIAKRGEQPSAIASDDGAELTSMTVLRRRRQTGVERRHIAPGKPMRNGFIDSFNGRFRDERLKQALVSTLADARTALRSWKDARPSATRRPPSSPHKSIWKSGPHRPQINPSALPIIGGRWGLRSPASRRRPSATGTAAGALLAASAPPPADFWASTSPPTMLASAIWASACAFPASAAVCCAS
jgi:putative transposase